MAMQLQSRPEVSRPMHVRPSVRFNVRPALAALGLVPRGDLLPDLSGWRSRRRRHA